MTSPQLADFTARVAKAFPDLQWETSRLITEGWDHAVVILDNHWVFRFPLAPDYGRQLAEEIEILKALAPRLNVQVPEYSLIPQGVGFAGYRMVRGRELTAERLRALDKAEQRRVVDQLTEFLGILHTFDHSDLPQLAPFHVCRIQTEVWHTLRNQVRPHLSKSEFNVAVAILEEVDQVLKGAPSDFLIHGDMYSRHLLWDERVSQLGIIDFSDMGRGDPAMDFAELYEYGSTFVEAVYEGYRGVKDAKFLSRAWTYQKWVGVYMLTDHFLTGKTTFAEARKTFDRVTAHQSG